MKKQSFFNKVIFIINTLFAFGLICAFFIPHLSPQKFGPLSLISLLVPILLIGNLLFVLYWVLIGFKKQMLQSFLVLVLSYFFIPSLYKFGDTKTVDNKESVSVMTYNIRKFNKYKWLAVENIDLSIQDFIKKEDPDIVALQEYQNSKNFKLDYPYVSRPLIDNYSDPVMNIKFRTPLIIYSKYPIINEGILKENLMVHTIFADIVKNKDTLRVYNFHFESLGVIPGEDYLGHKDSEKLIKRLNQSFKNQQKQINLLNKFTDSCTYKMILVGDMNNTSYSWAYENVKKELNDTFLEAGKGFGTTYKLKKIPLRIDYIFTDKSIEISGHKNFKEVYSDHFPVVATLEF